MSKKFKALTEFLGTENILLANGPTWQLHRILLAPLFAPARMQRMAPSFASLAVGFLAEAMQGSRSRVLDVRPVGCGGV
jgi:cytochrome P450